MLFVCACECEYEYACEESQEPDRVMPRTLDEQRC
jgi:hypothetical protein